MVIAMAVSMTVVVSMTMIAIVVVPVVTTRAILPVPFIVVGMLRVSPIPFLAAIAYDRLVIVPPVPCIPCSVPVVVYPWRTFIDHHLMSVIQVEIAVSRWQLPVIFPPPIHIVHIHLRVHVVVGVYVGYIIVLNIIVPYRSPKRLNTDVEMHTYLCVCVADK